jgi:hypothetical protein
MATSPVLPFQVWCVCGHISGQHAARFPHPCACDGNRWVDGRGSVCNCQAFAPYPHQRAMSRRHGSGVKDGTLNT